MTASKQHWLFLPGYACTAAIWQPVKHLLEPHAAVTALNWPREILPGLPDIASFARWLATNHNIAEFDLVCGHSMGGMVALTLAAQGLINTRIVLVESFITPPGPFFQNLLMPNCEPELKTRVTAMLETEAKFHNPSLRAVLRGTDLAPFLARVKTPVAALYGDRGTSPAAVAENLAWPAAVTTRVPVTVIPNACHFPMLENPPAAAKAILSA